jgi:hypothetical protein
MATRDDLHQLVSTLPEGALDAAFTALTHMQTWPPPELQELDRRASAMEQQIEERLERLRQGGSGGGGGFASFRSFSVPARSADVGPAFQQRGRQSSGHEEGDTSIYESHILYDEHEFVLVERITRDRRTPAVTFTIELTGPDGTTARHEHRYQV